MITPVQLNYIFALLEHRNFQRAAEACHITQPTLSMQVKKVEDNLGYRIFDRDTIPLSLTAEGQELLPYLSDLRGSYDNLEVMTQKLQGTYRPDIRLGILPTISNYLIPELYTKWRKKLKNINLDIIELTTHEILDAIRSKAIDLGILAGPFEEYSFVEHVLYNEEILVYAPSLESKYIHLHELDDMQPWLLSEDNCLRAQMIDFCNLHEEAKASWNYEGGNLHLLTTMVKQVGGYTLIPYHCLPVLNLEKKHVKHVYGHLPYRQIVGIHLKRNTKREDISLLTSIIRRRMYDHHRQFNKAELLPWQG